MSFDFNDAGDQTSFTPMPAGTIATLRLQLRLTVGDFIKVSKDGRSGSLDGVLTVLEPREFAGRKFYQLFMQKGDGSSGHQQAIEIANKSLKAILESARGVKPDDLSDAAKAARKIGSYAELDCLAFMAKLTVQAENNGYAARNRLGLILTPDMTSWKDCSAYKQDPAPAPAEPAGGGRFVMNRPAWADEFGEDGRPVM